MNFDALIEESYRGFGQSSHLDLSDLRLMYYGRNAIYVAFTDNGEYELSTTSYEMDRPDGLICYEVNDVVGNKVKSSEFYFNILRLDKKNLLNISSYTAGDLKKDISKLHSLKIDQEILQFYLDEVVKDTTIKTNFERLWILTENIARIKSDYGSEWASILMALGYSAISDTTGTGLLIVGRTPVTICLDMGTVTDIDILPAQKFRKDPRKRTQDMVTRKLRLLRNTRNRVAKRKPSRL